MLMAMLYMDDDFIGAAAPACDVLEYGPDYWNDVFPGQLQISPAAETAYLPIDDPEIRRQLARVGIDQVIDGYELAQQVEQLFKSPAPRRDAA